MYGLIADTLSLDNGGFTVETYYYFGFTALRLLQYIHIEDSHQPSSLCKLKYIYYFSSLPLTKILTLLFHHVNNSLDLNINKVVYGLP